MEGYGPTSYGDGFAEVYDAWYPGSDDVAAVVGFVAELAGSRPGRLLELGVGTGRLAIPLAVHGMDVYGVDTSSAMLDRLRARDPDGRVTVAVGDMVDDQPAGPFDVVLVAYNTLFNLESAERQASCFVAAAERLASEGALVVEAFVPEDPPRERSSLVVRSMTASEVVLSASSHDPAGQRAQGLRRTASPSARWMKWPWAIRYAPPAELDAMANDAGLSLRERWEDFRRRPFTADSPRHVSVYGP